MIPVNLQKLFSKEDKGVAISIEFWDEATAFGTRVSSGCQQVIKCLYNSHVFLSHFIIGVI